MFFASDEAARRMGWPALHVHIVLELGGRLDLPGFHQALRALYRVYPTAAASLERAPLTGWPRWRLHEQSPDPRRVVTLHRVDPPTEPELTRRIHDVCARALDVASRPPVRLHVFQGLARGDVLLMRWPHALMDARGGMALLDEINRLYEEAPDPDTLRSAGDEQRDDFARIVAGVAPARRAGILCDWLARRKPAPRKVVGLARGPVPEVLGPPRFVLRRLTPEQTRRVSDNALRVCGFARFGDYVRGCALHALHRVAGRPVSSDAVYTTLNLVNARKGRDAGPVCWNLTSGLPLSVPARIADHPARIADAIRDQMLAHVAEQTRLRGMVVLSLLMRAPLAAVAAFVGACERGRSGAGRAALLPPPSLPLGLLGPSPRVGRTYCGAELVNFYGFRTPRPTAGFAVDVNTTRDRMNIAGTCFESRVPLRTLETLLDAIVATLLEPA